MRRNLDRIPTVLGADCRKNRAKVTIQHVPKVNEGSDDANHCTTYRCVVSFKCSSTPSDECQQYDDEDKKGRLSSTTHLGHLAVAL